MKKLLLLFSFLLISALGWGQVTTIDFETAGSGYTPSTTYGSGNIDTFNRVNSGVNGNSTYYWVAEDISGNPSITLDQINIIGTSSFNFSIDLSYANNAAWDSTDEFIITYSIDGGTFQNLVAVQHLNSDAYNNPAALDFDFDGNGDSGQELSTTTFTTYTTSEITLNNNTTLDIKLQYNNLTSNDEGIFIDNIIITETPSGPTITTSPSSLTGFTYIEGNGPSAEQSFTVEGSSLTNDIDVTPPTNWEISLTSGSGFQTSAITLAQSGGTVAATTIYTRMVSGLLNANSPFNGNIACTSTGATQQDVAVDGTVTDPNVPQAIYAGSFEDGDEVWTYYNGGGTGDWERTTDGGTYSPGDNGYDGTYYGWYYGYNEDAEDWLISPSYDFSSYTNIEMDFWSWMRNTGPNIIMKISTDYTGDPTNASWTDLTPTLATTEQLWTTSGNVDLSAIADGESNVHIAFYYTGTDVDRNWAIDDYELRGLVANCTEPTVDATFHVDSPQNISTTSLTLNWTNGNGIKRIVVMKEASAITFTPTDGITYAANATFGSSTDVGSGEYIVYNGNGTTVDVSGLTPGKLYYAVIYEYACTPGSEDYYTTGTPSTDSFLTEPENPSLTTGCIGNTTIDLTWTAPAIGNFDGYLLVVREGAVPHSVNSTDPSSITGESLDYTTASTFGSTTPNSRYLYKGSNTNVTVTGLTNNTSYTFMLYTFSDAGTIFEYSTGTQTTKTIGLLNVSSEQTSTGNTQLDVAWINPDASCFDEIMVVANETAGITFTPSGDGTAYTANSTYSGVDSIVYKGAGNTVTVTGLSNGTTYYFEIFIRKGTEWSSGVETSETPNTTTILETGDLAILAVNTDTDGTGLDEVSFVCFKDITPNTKIYLTDNGYQRQNATQWGGTEGVISLIRIGSTLTKGTIISIKATTPNITSSTHFDVYTCGVIDTNWTKDAISGTGIGGFNLNSDDDLWIMQGGIWSNDTSHQSNYSGNVLYGWTESGWDVGVGTSTTGDTKWSSLFPNSKCFTTIAPLGDGKVKFNDPNDPDFSTTTNDQLDWIALINTTNNWDTYTDNSTYNAGGFDYLGDTNCPQITITTSTHTTGKWLGTSDTNWFNCSNWDALTVPDTNTDVVIDSNANNQATIDATATDADLYNGIAQTNDLTIQNGIWVEILNTNDKLEIYGDLLIENGANIDMDGTTTSDGTIDIYGNWTNQAGQSAFYEGTGTVRFVGNTAQTIATSNSGTTETEQFANLEIDNPAGVSFTNNNIHAAENLTITNSPALTVANGQYILVGKNLTTNTAITVEHGGSLVQTDDTGVNGGTANTNYSIKKTANQTAVTDVTYFATPTATTSVNDMVSNTTYHYDFDASVQNWNYSLDPTANMTIARGYILRNPVVGGDYTVNFTGEINNGAYTAPVLITGTGAQDDDDWNLLGNPYPSAIDADLLFATNSAVIKGAVYYWKHLTVLNGAGNDYVDGGYTVYNGTGGTAIVGGTIGNTAATQYIPSGVAFFVEATANGDVTFSNAHRVTGNNNTVFRIADNANRIWLNIIENSTNKGRQQLIGFFDEATDDVDNLYDAHALDSGLSFYSLLNNEKYSIQSKDNNYEGEIIPLGYNAPQDGTFTITIDHTTGTIAANGNYIYLKDNELNIVHDLTDSDYTFSSVLGENNTRFELFATQQALDIREEVYTNNDSLFIIQNNNSFELGTATNATIKQVTVYDVVGRKLIMVSNNTVQLDVQKGQVLIFEVLLENGSKLSKKVIKM